MSWWLQATYYPNGVPIDPADDEELQLIRRYIQRDPMTLARLESARPVLDRLQASLTDLQDEVEETEARLRQQDPHLDRALAAPSVTPFRSEDPIVPRDVAAEFLPGVDAMVADYLATTEDPRETSRRIAGPMRRCLRATLLKETIPPDDFGALQAAWQDGVDDPLLLLCLFRSSDQHDERREQWIHEAQRAREKRQVSPATAALISSNRLDFQSSLSQYDAAQACQTFIRDTANLWQHFEDYETDFAAQDLFIDYTYNGMRHLNSTGKLELLLALEEKTAPRVDPWVLHFVSSLVFRAAASTYRGTNFISDTDPRDLEHFRQLAARETQHLLKAWTLAPRFPLIPTLLMDVEMRAGSTPRSFDAWFRHSLAARFSNDLNFSYYWQRLQQKWGGSREKQIWFAEKCVETSDLPSRIPFRFADSLDVLLRETAFCEPLGNDLKIQRLVQKFVRLLREHSARDPHPAVTRQTLYVCVPVLWQAARFEDVHWLLDGYREDVVCRDYHCYQLHADEMFELSRVMVESPAPCWMNLYMDLFGDTRRLTLRDLEHVDSEIQRARQRIDDSESDLALVLDRCQRRATFLRKFLSREPVVLSDRDLADWMPWGQPFRCEFVSQGDASSSGARASDSPKILSEGVGAMDMSVTIDKSMALRICPVRIDPPLSIRMEVETIVSGSDPFGVSLLVGPTSAAIARSDYLGPILSYMKANSYAIRDHLPRVEWIAGRRHDTLLEKKPQHTFKIEAFPDGYRTYADGRLLETVHQRLNTAGIVQIGRYNNAQLRRGDAEVTYRISNVCLQKLREPSVDSSPTL